MSFDPLWIPIIGTVAGCLAIPIVVALVLERQREEKRLQVQYEAARLEQEWEAARARDRSKRP